MRIICAADLHLGAGPDLAVPPASRLEDQAAAWRAVCSRAQDADLMIFAGDAFHRRKPTPAELMAFDSGLDALMGTPVLAIPGNHDVTTADAPNALSVFAKRIALCNTPRVVELAEGVAGAPRGGISIATLPWVPSAGVRARAGDVALVDDTSVSVSEMLVAIARSLHARCKAPTKVLVLHWSITGSTTPSGALTDDFREPVVPLVALDEMGWSAVVCGHIHRYQVHRGNIFYPGSVLAVDWSETVPGEKHGCVLLNLDGGGSRAITHYSVPDHRYLTINLDDEPTDTDLLRWSNAVVRVRYTVTAEQHKATPPSMIAARMREAGVAHVFAIQPTVVRERVVADHATTSDMQPLEALERYLDRRQVAEDVRGPALAAAGPIIDEARGIA